MANRNTINKILLIFISLVVAAGVFFVAKIVISKEQTSDSTNFRNFAGEGNKENPYLINNAADLKKLEEAVANGEGYADAVYELTEDIDMEGESLRIGIDEDTPFRGEFYGKGHYITGINSVMTDQEAGLFAGLRGKVYNLCVSDSYFEGKIAGGIASSIRGGYIVNCISEATVKGSELCGTITGSNSGYIINCAGLSSVEPIGYEDAYGYYNYVYTVYDGDVVSVKDEVKDSESELLAVLNNNIGKIGCDFPVRNWSKNDKLRPDGDCTIRYSGAYAYANIAGKIRKLTGFFADDYGKWCIFIPKGCMNKELKVVLTGDNGTHTELVSLENKKTVFSKDGVNYEIEIVEFSDAPTLFIDINRNDGLEYLYKSKDNNTEANITELSPDGTIVQKLAAKSVGCRGNSSFVSKLSNKNSFKIDFSQRESVCGMDENDNYVLLAGFRETSVLSYLVENGMYKAAKIPFVADNKLVNVFVNDTYLGAYILSGAQEVDKGRYELRDIMAETAAVNGGSLKKFEQIKEGEDLTPGCRVYYDIPNNPEDITGDYLIEIDTGDYPDSRARFVSDHNISIAMKGDNFASKEQLYYIADFWQDFENALFSDDGYNDKGKYYTDYIDLKSLANIALAFEITEDASMHGSIYFYKESDVTGDGKLHASYHWDCEHSFMVTDKLYTEKYLENSRRMGRVEESAPLWLNIYKHEDAYECIKTEYREKYESILCNVLSGPDKENSIEYFRKLYKESGYANSCRWINSSFEKKADDIKFFLTERKGVLDSWLLNKP